MKVIVPVMLLVLVGTLSKLVFKVALFGMAPYAIVISFLNALMFVPAFTIGYFFIGNRSGFSGFPFGRALMVAMLDVTTMIMHGLPSGRIGAPMLVLLGQSKVPFSMLLAIGVLGTQYTRSQYLGAVLIVMGIAVATWPCFE
jgi:hypothetical protein